MRLWQLSYRHYDRGVWHARYWFRRISDARAYADRKRRIPWQIRRVSLTAAAMRARATRVML